MKFEVQFINFPSSDTIRTIINSRISDCLERFSIQPTSIRAFFSTDGNNQHVKFVLHVGQENLNVHFTALDLPHAVDKALQKLEAVLRKSSAKRKHKKHQNVLGYDKLTQHVNAHIRRNKLSGNAVNVFDKYENAYMDEFESRTIPRAS